MIAWLTIEDDDASGTTTVTIHGQKPRRELMLRHITFASWQIAMPIYRDGQQPPLKQEETVES